MELVKCIGGLLSGASIGSVLLVYLLLHPEKIEIWSSLLWRLLSSLGSVFKFAHKKYVKYDIQGRVNRFAKELSKNAPYLAEERVRVEWVRSNISRESFLQDGRVILRLRRDDPDDMNFAHGAYLFVSTSLLFELKRYISQSQRQAIDLYVTTKLIEQEKPSVVGHFLDQYLHPELYDTESKTARYFDTYARIDDGGLFYPVFLQELDFLGDKVFGERRDDEIIREVNWLIDFLKQIATRTIGEEGNLDFKQEYCSFAVVIVGKPAKLTPSGDVYVDYIKKHLVPSGFETIYVLSLWENRGVIDSICEALIDSYEKCRTLKQKAVLRYGDQAVDRQQFLAVLRRKGIEIFRPSD